MARCAYGFAWCVLLLAGGLPLRAQEQQAPAAAPAPAQQQPPDDRLNSPAPGHIVSRVIHLYYFRDANRVAGIINSSARLKDQGRVDELEKQLDEVRSQASQLLAQRQAADARIQLVANTERQTSSTGALIPVQSPQPERLSEKLIELLAERQRIDAEEQQLREKQFRIESKLQDLSKDSFAVGDREAEDPVAQVSINVVGEGELHLRGPQKGVNKIVRIIHQIDKPVGQVKVRLHTVQVNGEKSDAMEAVHDAIDAHINHARALSMHAALLYPLAVGKVFTETLQKKGQEADPTCVFCKKFTLELGKLGSPLLDKDGPFSISSFDNTSLAGALYLTALAEDDVRQAIYETFLQSVRRELAQDELEYFQLLKRAEARDRFAGGLLFGRYLQNAKQLSDLQVRDWASQSFRFTNLGRLLLSQSTGIGSLNSVQASTLQLARGLKQLHLLESELQNLLLERSLFERTAGEIEAKAVETRRQVEECKAALQKETYEAEAVVAEVLATVLTGLRHMSQTSEIPESQRRAIEQFQVHLKRLEDPKVQKDVATLILRIILQSSASDMGTPLTDSELAEALYQDIALYMQQTLGVVFGVTEEQNQTILRLAKQQIIPRTDRLRAAARQWTLAQARMETADQQYQRALKNNDVCSRQLFAKRVLDQFIDEQEEKVAAVWEALRPHVATIDAYLKQMAIAFEDDVNEQFYKPAFQDIRRAAREWDVALGQMETTAILTNDRMPASVNPAQTVQFDLPKRDLLVKEVVSGAEAVMGESRTLLTKLGVRSAADAVGPAVSTLTDSVPVGAPFGSQLQQQVPASRLYTLEAGNDFQITPVIQPDGSSIAYQFDYTYTTNVSEPAGPDDRQLPRIKRHFVKTEVQTSSYELREISRFRVAINTTKTERGVRLLEDIPVVGGLFRPPATRAVSLQENIILADCVVYPTVFDLMGRRWLKPAEYIDPEPLFQNDTGRPNRQQELRNRLLTITREEVENLLGLEMTPVDPGKMETDPFRIRQIQAQEETLRR